MPDIHPEQAKLLRHLDGRPCVVMANGPSLEELSRHALPDVCYVGMNKWGPGETEILEPQDLHTDIVFNAAPRRIDEEAHNLVDFMRDGGLWITRWNAWNQWSRRVGTDAAVALEDHTVVTLCEGGGPPKPEQAWPLFEPVPWDVMTVGLVTIALLKCGVEKIAIAGADSGPMRGVMYFEDAEYDETEKQNNQKSIARDTDNLNRHWKGLCERAEVEHSDERVRLLCPHSLLSCFVKTSMIEGLEWVIS